MAALDNVASYVVKDGYLMAETITQIEDLERLLRDAPLPMVAARIKRARKTLSLSHDKLGERMGGVFRQTLIGYEKGEHRPKLPMLLRLADATGREARWFVDPDAEPAPFRAEEAA